jgi:hypothetical protein
VVDVGPLVGKAVTVVTSTDRECGTSYTSFLVTPATYTWAGASCQHTANADQVYCDSAAASSCNLPCYVTTFPTDPLLLLLLLHRRLWLLQVHAPPGAAQSRRQHAVCLPRHSSDGDA